MRFYYISLISVFMLIVIWFVGTGLLVWLGSHLRKTRKRVWPIMVPLFLLLYIGPISEELWISWNFGQLCKKDAGIFIYKTVEVRGFYDSTRPTHAGPPTAQAIESFEKGGYQFYEMLFPNKKGGPHQVVHIEKINGVWTPTILDQPTARYQYLWPDMNRVVSHKVERTERLVLDRESGETLGRYVDYGRRAALFFIGLDSPLMFCREAVEDARQRGNVFGPNMVLRPRR